MQRATQWCGRGEDRFNIGRRRQPKPRGKLQLSLALSETA